MKYEFLRLKRYWVDLASKHPVGVRVTRIGIALIPLLCVIFVAILQFTRPGYNPWQDTISMLVWGPHGWVLTGAFFLMAFSVLVLVIKLLIKPGTSIRYKIGISLFFLMGIGAILIGMHPTDAPGVSGTTTGVIHIMTTAALIFLFPAVCFLMAPTLKNYLSQKWITVYTRVTGVTALTLIAIIGVLFTNNLGFTGIMERLIALNGLAWIQVMHIQFF